MKLTTIRPSATDKAIAREIFKEVTRKFIFNTEAIKEAVLTGANQALLRHEFTNYDKLTKLVNKKAESLAVNEAAVHLVQNFVNNKLDAVKTKVISTLLLNQSTSVTVVTEVVAKETATADSIELQYLRAGVSNTAAKLLADSKAANAAIRGVAVVNIPTSTTVDTFKW